MIGEETTRRKIIMVGLWFAVAHNGSWDPMVEYGKTISFGVDKCCMQSATCFAKCPSSIVDVPKASARETVPVIDPLVA
jgi:heterodisulfide reductase subunit C